MKKVSWLVILCIGLMLCGCSREAQVPEVAEEEVFRPASEDVLEVGVLADCSDPYAVVTYESFIKEAGSCEFPIVVEVRDCRSGWEAQQDGLSKLKERGLDILLVDVMDPEYEDEVTELLKEVSVPVWFFGTRPSDDFLEAVLGVYVGLAEEEVDEYAKVIQDDRFDESGYREKATVEGARLYTQVVDFALE